MTIIFASDIHGSVTQAKKIVDIFHKHNADKLILLGDIYYHGPRNALPDGYSPMDVSNILNSISEKIVAVRGNCDSEVDEMISNFKFLGKLSLVIDDKIYFLQHGHIFNPNNLPNEKFDVMMNGHFHVGQISQIGNKVFCNTGSTTLPKEDSFKSYILLKNGILQLRNIENDDVIEQINV